MVTLALRNLTKILAGVCLVLVASIGYAKTSETPEVGAIGQIKGSGVLERGKDIVIDGNVGVAVRSMDEAVTANGTMRINFIDDTRVELTEQSRLVIDEFVYDPSQDLGSPKHESKFRYSKIRKRSDSKEV